MDELPTEIIMIIVKMLPNFEDRMALGLTSQRYWDIMIQSRSPEDPSLQFVENQALAKKVLNWVETRPFVSMVTYEKSGFVSITLNLEIETSKKAQDILELASKICFNLAIYVNRDSMYYPLFENHPFGPTKFRINNNKITTETAMNNIFTKFPLIDRVTSIRCKNMQPKNERNLKHGDDIIGIWSMFLICRDHSGYRCQPQKYLSDMKNMCKSFKDIAENSIDARFMEDLLGASGEGLRLLSANIINLTDNQKQMVNVEGLYRSLYILCRQNIKDFERGVPQIWRKKYIVQLNFSRLA